MPEIRSVPGPAVALADGRAPAEMPPARRRWTLALAGLRGSPLSGGYAGAKATVRFITSYAAEESARAGLGIRFLSVLPQLTPATDLGAAGAAAYARRAGLDTATFVRQLSPVLTPEQAGQSVLELVTSAGPDARAFLLSGRGLTPVTD